jgi:hypothetical protein
MDLHEDPPECSPQPLQLNVCSDGTRVVVIRTTEGNNRVMRVRSMPLGQYTFEQTRNAMDAGGDADIILIPLNAEALQPLRDFVGDVPHYERTLDQAFPQLVATCINHIQREASHDQRVMFRGGNALPPRMQRAYARLGPDGYAILGGQQVFGKSRASQRLAAATYSAYRSWPARTPLRDGLTKELVALNLVGQAFQALENFAAFFTALKATSDGDHAQFATAFLTFARTEREYRSANIMQTLDELSGNNAGNVIGKVFQIPLNPERISALGLADCGIDPAALMRCGQFTLGFMKLSFRLLARVLVRKERGTGRASKTPQYRVYGAVRHGFAVAIPWLDPANTAVAYSTADFPTDDAFESYVRESDILGTLLYLDDDGNVSSTHPPVTLGELKPLMRVVFRCGFWIREFGSFAERLYASVDGRFPYLMNAINFLGPEQRAILEGRLRIMDGE